MGGAGSLGVVGSQPRSTAPGPHNHAPNLRMLPVGWGCEEKRMGAQAAWVWWVANQGPRRPAPAITSADNANRGLCWVWAGVQWEAAPWPWLRKNRQLPTT